MLFGLFKFSNKQETPKLQITAEMRNEYFGMMCKMMDVRMNLKRQLKNTHEVFYKEIAKSMDDSIKKTKKAYNLGIREYKVNGKSAKIIANYEKASSAFRRDLFMLRVKVEPDLATETVLEWVAYTEQEESKKKGQLEQE